MTYAGTLTGVFDTISGLPSGYAVNYGDGSNDAITLAVIPEPASLTLLALGGLLLLRRRRRGTTESC